MPVGKISKSGNSFTGAAEYDLAQGKYRRDNKTKKPEILQTNLIYSNYYKDIGREFRALSISNQKCKKPVLKFSISFDPVEKLTDEQKIELTLNVMREIGISEDHQFMITRHSDKNHDHHHILANRVGLNGKVISDSYIINRLETSLDKVEKMMGLENNLAKKRRYVYDKDSEKGYKVQIDNFGSNKEVKNTSNSKKGIAKRTEYILQNLEVILQQAKDFNDLYFLLKSKGIESKLRFNNSQKLSGISFEFNGFSIKGSALGSKYKAAKIEEALKNNSLSKNIEKIILEENIKTEASDVEKIKEQIKLDIQNIDQFNGVLFFL